MSQKPIDNTESEDEPSERELRISQLLAEFLKQEDEGTALSREEFLESNADVAEDLIVLLEMADMIQEMAGPLSGDEFGLNTGKKKSEEVVANADASGFNSKLDHRTDALEDTNVD